MALIFDGFPSEGSANRFAERVRGSFGLDCLVFRTQAESDRVDPFPLALNPPIVLVRRTGGSGVEDRVIKAVRAFGGEWAGT